MDKILTFMCTNSRQVSTCAPKESDFFRLTKDVVRDKNLLEVLEKLLCEDAWERRQEGEDLTYDDGSKSKRFQCRSEEILAKVKPLLMPYWREMMPNFDFANVIGWSILWVESGRDAFEAHFDELRQWYMAVVFSVGKPGKLVIKTHPGEEAPDEWITREITGNSLYILRGSEHVHQLVEERFVETERAAVTHGAAQDAAQDVVAVAVAGIDAIGHGEGKRPRMVGDDPESDVDFFEKALSDFR